MNRFVLALILTVTCVAPHAYAYQINAIGSTPLTFGVGATSSTVAEKMRLTAAGFVGIGTPAPSATLHISSSSLNGLTIEGNGTAGRPGIMLVDTTNGTFDTQPTWGMDNKADSFRIFRKPTIGASGFEGIHITNAGFVGMGPTNPSTRLEVAGTVSATAFTGDGSQLTNIVAGYTGALVSGGKTGNDCMDAGGRPTAVSGGYMCQFNGSMNAGACPAGWALYSNMTRTSAKTCTGGSSGCTYSATCTTGSHTLSNTVPETCNYSTRASCSGGCLNQVCTADMFSVGCI